MKNGGGFFFDLDGNVYEGIWKNDKLQNEKKCKTQPKKVYKI